MSVKQLRTLESKQEGKETEEKRKECVFKGNWAHGRQNWWEVQRRRDEEMKKQKGKNSDTYIFSHNFFTQLFCPSVVLLQSSGRREHRFSGRALCPEQAGALEAGCCRNLWWLLSCLLPWTEWSGVALLSVAHTVWLTQWSTEQFLVAVLMCPKTHQCLSEWRSWCSGRAQNPSYSVALLTLHSGHSLSQIH